ncbi:MAG TPA: glycoside hydrolase family 2 TIM barrel-domain containing protein [Lacipirellulaceae bacterium]|nr:glycoside hydrolase family 2 TIM barrel-domain containing protein [Lacipirellulaceae bacterium]
MARATSNSLISQAVIAAATLWSAAAPGREQTLLDADWRFHLGDDPAAAQADVDDAAWRVVQLPHDWSIESAPVADAPSGSEGGYFPTGVGWYRRTFGTPDGWQKNQRIIVRFDGVYRHAQVWINGQRLGTHAYGYTPFEFDVTSQLRAAGKPNVLAVRVDNAAQPSSRWYTGSGIYRHVWLEARPPVHLVRDALFARTSAIEPGRATLQVDGLVRNMTAAPGAHRIEAELLGPDGASTASDAGGPAELPSGGDAPLSLRLSVPAPKLWSPDSPSLYTLVVRVVEGAQVVDELRTAVGIRTVRVSPERGFELNGAPLKLMGGCVHHDNGPLGAAAFDRAEFRRVRLLKSAGFNAIRAAHNPPSTAFLDACDELGMLVVDEAFDGWAKAKKPQDYHRDFPVNWRDDLQSMVRRDRNHPSVVVWSIGNEMQERGEPQAASMAAQMRAAVVELDATRPITVACNSIGDDSKWPGLDPVFAAVDVAGYNYELDRIAPDHERLHNRVAMITESFLSEAFAAWDLTDRSPHLIGEFVWTSLDYLGEAGIGRVFPPGEKVRQHWEGPHFPWHGAYCGDIDLIGHRKPISHYRNIIWNRGETLHMAVVAPGPDGKAWQPTLWALPPELESWTWPGAEGRELEVRVSSRHPRVRLFLNDSLVGEAATGREQQFLATFRVGYAPGRLHAVGVDASNHEVERTDLVTVAEPARLALAADRTTLYADGQDLAFVEVAVTDAAGRCRTDAANTIGYNITGPATIAALGSADLATSESYQANPRRVFQGRALVVVRTTGTPGRVALTAVADGFPPATVELNSVAPQ